MSKMTLKTEGDTHVVVTRRFAAPPEAVYRAHTEPKLIQQWLLGPDGWSMPVCISDAQTGGKIRYEWTNGKGRGFHVTGEYLELEPFHALEYEGTTYDCGDALGLLRANVAFALKHPKIGADARAMIQGLLGG